ncbi:energy transducer TonB [Rhodoplanes roseus]|uniref:Protein TonB n=1 Tax=Rhodoplanes roseus TaxID=29409 RepID=A0A327L7L0_9BRAD|nr:energy transducer TonB [Rhodoplanes roseus]RAI45492.1 hypothetical protein CH341_03635 [Rhodoplanes roseus]
MKVSRSLPDPQRGLLTVVPGRAPDNDVFSKAPAVELRRDSDPGGDGIGTGNVVLLAHVRAERDHPGAHAAAPVAPPSPDDRPAVSSRGWSRRRSVVVAACSLTLHAAILVAFAHEPPPVASVGLEVISVEMVLGADSMAGVSSTPSPSEAAPTEEAKQEPEKTEPEKQVEEAKAPEPEPTPEEPPVEQQVAVAQPDPPPEPQKDEPPPPPEPTPVIEKEAPETVAAIPPEPPKPQPKLEVKPEIKPAPKPKPKAKPEPKKRTAARTSNDARETNTSPARSSSAAGIGVGRSDLNTNYRGIVAAHLARHKQFPAEARASGQQGSTSVSFTIDGSGRVTSVRLGRGSGIASLDQETTAMVRRASPFPPPPSGQSMTFSVPVSFFLR